MPVSHLNGTSVTAAIGLPIKRGLDAACQECDGGQITHGPTALKFPGLWGLVSGFLRLVTVWLHVGRGGVTGSDGP